MWRENEFLVQLMFYLIVSNYSWPPGCHELCAEVTGTIAIGAACSTPLATTYCLGSLFFLLSLGSWLHPYLGRQDEVDHATLLELGLLLRRVPAPAGGAVHFLHVRLEQAKDLLQGSVCQLRAGTQPHSAGS